MTKETTPAAVELLEEDHDKVKALFEQFEKAESSEKEELVDQIDLELRVHAMIEEEILYPALRDIDQEITAESFEEHGVVEQLLDELATMDLTEDQFEAKFKVMKENVEHHIEEEEGEMFPKCPQIPSYEEIGLQLIQRKMELLEELREASPVDRVEGGDPATMRASEKSEATLSAAEQAPVKSRRAASADKRKAVSRGRSSRSEGPRSGQATANPIQLQKYLAGVDYPAKKQELVGRAKELGADEAVLQTLERLDETEFQTPAEVSKAVGAMD